MEDDFFSLNFHGIRVNFLLEVIHLFLVLEVIHLFFGFKHQNFFIFYFILFFIFFSGTMRLLVGGFDVKNQKGGKF